MACACWQDCHGSKPASPEILSQKATSKGFLPKTPSSTSSFVNPDRDSCQIENSGSLLLPCSRIFHFHSPIAYSMEATLLLSRRSPFQPSQPGLWPCTPTSTQLSATPLFPVIPATLISYNGLPASRLASKEPFLTPCSPGH